MHRFLIHQNGPALWPEHKTQEEVLRLKNETPENIWEGTYQGNPTPPAGTIFKRAWWQNGQRFDAADIGLVNTCVGRWISWDTALKDTETNAYTAAVIGELWRDYRLAIRLVWRDRMQFPDLPQKIESLARTYNRDGKLRGIIIEDKASGISALQTLSSTAEAWIKPLLIAFMPQGDKPVRAQQAAVHCKNGSVLLPYPGNEVGWLMDFEDELFDFPGSAFKDQVDAFSQLVLYTENLLAAGYEARKAHGEQSNQANSAF
jgi:predicted phage terminase large subunit-like protein